MRTLVKKLDAAARLAPALLARAPSFKAAAGALADSLHEVLLSNGETVHLHLPHHTHLNPGDILLDSMGMMVRVAAAEQSVLAVRHDTPQTLLGLALAANKQGRALGWEADALLLAHDAVLAQHLSQNGFTVVSASGRLNLPLMGLPLPEHDCGHADHGHSDHTHSNHTHKPAPQGSLAHEHHTHEHHMHGQAGHVHGPDCKH